MKKLLLILFLFSLLAGCASSNYGDPTRQRDAQKIRKENNKNLRSQFGNRQ